MLDALGSTTRGFNRLINRHVANFPLTRRIMRTFPVPDDLASVTDIDHASEVAPKSVGLNAEAIQNIWRATEDLYCTGYYPAVMLCIRRHGKIVLNRAIGYAQGIGEPGGPDLPKLATTNTPSCIFSASKAVTAMLIHKLADDGVINLLDPVAHYVPEFAQNGKERISILQVLAHRGGVPGIKKNATRAELIDQSRFLKLICQASPIDAHGRTQAYHALTAGAVLQAVLERASGTPIETYWQEHFKKPMGFRYLDYGASKRDFANMARDRISGMHLSRPIVDYLRTYLAVDIEAEQDMLCEHDFFAEPISAGNMVATAEEASRFFQMLLDGGRYGDRQIVSPLTVHRATHEMSPHQFDNVLKIPLRFSPGMMLGGAPIGLYGPNTNEAYGHVGLINIMIWADPQRDISVALLNTGKPLLAHNIPTLYALLCAINHQLPPVRRRRP